MLSQVGEEGRSRQMPDGFDVASDAPDVPALGGEPVPLSSLIGHGVRLQWYEAVGVIQEICERRAKTQPPDPIPDLAHTSICPDGRVAISPGTVATESAATQPAAALGQLLHTLVDEMGLPIQLDLVVQAAMSPTPPQMTVNEFSEALVRFDRPNRALALRDVYGRWSALPPEVKPEAVPVVTAPPPPLPQIKAVVERTPPHDAMDLFVPEQRPPRLVRFPVIPVAAAACVIVAAAGVAAWGLPGGSTEPPSAPSAPPVFAEARKVASLVPQAWTTAGDPETASNALGLDTVPGLGLREVQAPTSTARGPVSRLTPSGSSAQLAPTAALPAAPPPAGSGTQAVEPPPTAPLSAPTRDVVVDERLEAPPSEPVGPVFSSSDGDVVPPVLVQPRLSLEPPAGVPLGDLSVFDILVSDDGRVETIRLAGPARDYREAMILSAIKMWRFRPAMKDGRPVRYMRRVWISVSAAATIVG
jgi:hypothetical protein